MENGVTHNNLTKNNVKIVIPLKYLSNFCEVELILTWFKNYLLIDKITRDADYEANPHVSEINNPENAIFQITDTNL